MVLTFTTKAEQRHCAHIVTGKPSRLHPHTIETSGIIAYILCCLWAIHFNVQVVDTELLDVHLQIQHSKMLCATQLEEIDFVFHIRDLFVFACNGPLSHKFRSFMAAFSCAY
jgi:hypothetical protein